MYITAHRSFWNHLIAITIATWGQEGDLFQQPDICSPIKEAKLSSVLYPELNSCGFSQSGGWERPKPSRKFCLLVSLFFSLHFCGTVKGSLFWLSKACSGDPVENSTRDRTVSSGPRDRHLTPQSPQFHNSVTISHTDKAPISTSPSLPLPSPFLSIWPWPAPFFLLPFVFLSAFLQ